MSASCGDPLPVSARLTDECGNALAGRRLNFVVGTLSASATTDDNGVASASLVPPPSAAPHPLTVEFAGDEQHSPARDTSSVRVSRVNTSLRYTGEAVLAAGTASPVSAVLTEATGRRPVPNAVLQFEVGSARVSATTDAGGVATANITLPPTETFGRSSLRINFAGDDCHAPASASAEVTAYLRTSFVIWGGNAERLRLGQRVNFWGHSWAKQIAQGDYKAHNDFKGYADTVRQFGLCQVNVRTTSTPPLNNSCWSTKPGQSFPPETIPEYIGVIVTTSADKAGAPDFGNIAALVVVKVDPSPAYGAVPGKPGFGTVFAVIADGEGVFPAPPALAAAQTQPASVLPAQNLSVTLNVSNTSAAAATGVTVGETFTNAAPPAASADLGTLAASAAQTRSFGVTITALQPRRDDESSRDYEKRLGAADGTVYASHGRISFQDASGRALTPVFVSSSSRLQIPRLAVGIRATPCVSPGAVIPYVITLTNIGGAAAASAAAVVTFPDGTSTRVETVNLEPGQVFNATVNWTVPPVAAKGASESDTEYLARLTSFDGRILRAAASGTWKDALGNDYGAVEQECRSVKRVPILSQSAQSPAPMLPGQRLTLPAAVRNRGSGEAQGARLRVTNPDATVFDAQPFGLAAGSSSDVALTLTAPPVAPKAADETDAAYLARLRADDDRPIDFTLALEWADAAGNTYGPVAGSLRTAEVLPIIVLTLSAPETVEAGETITYRVEASNAGHAEATGLDLSLTLPGGRAQPVTLAAPTLAPGARQAAVVSFAVPAAQPEGQMSAQASALWKDAVVNGYGPVSASAATNVLNPNRPPLVDAGPDRSVVLPSTAALQGTASDDGKPVGSALTVLWTKVSGPGAVTFGNPTQAVTTASFTAEGTYVLRLTASDSVLSASDETTVNVSPPPSDPVYGEDSDLTGGEGVNVVGDEFKHLNISNEATPFNFIWVAVSSKGTVVKIDTDTGKVLGEYWSSPAGQPKDPSRTTVDLNGNVWASNRAGNSVLRIGLVENGQCVDRNGNGRIDTSAGFGDVRPWTNAGGVDTDGGVETAADECVINYTRVRASGTRHVSVNALNDVWVSGTGGQRFDLLDGATGQIKRQEASVGHGGYGGLIDKRGVIWSARPLLRWDTALALKGANGGNWRGYGHDSYGLCIDSKGNVWNTALGGNHIYKFAPDGTHLATYNHGSHWAQGCVVDRKDHVWVAHSLHTNTVGHLKPDGTWVGNVPVGNGPTGVAVDAKGKIWATNHNSRTVSRIDPEAGPMGADEETRVGQVDLTTIDLKGSLYNYSDMTGSTLSGAPSAGTWTQVFDSGIENAGWGVVGWDGRVCGDASLAVRASSSADGVNFSAPVEVANGATFSVPAGRHLKVSVTFRRASSGESPFLYGLTVGTKGYRLADAGNPAPAVDAGPDQTATMPNSANLVGSACDAGRVSGLSVTWEKVSGPGEVSFANARVPATQAAFSEAGEYTLRLSAGDAGRTSADEMTVLVLPFNDPPAVNAGADQNVILPAASSLTGTVTDDALPRNSSVAASWSKLSGPGEVTFANSTSAATTATFTAPGEYVLRLAGDDSQLVNVDDVSVKVYPPNNSPAVNVGEDLTIRLPDKAALNSTVTDDGLPLGKTVAVTWSKVSGPGTVSFGNSKAADTTAAFGAPGTYVLRLSATDTQLSGSDELSVVVNPANQPPAVDAGADQTVTLPDAAGLTGNVADDELPEGRVISVTWSKVSGPGAVSFAAPNSPATAVTFSEAGAYVLRLTASDSALSRADDVAVVVNPSPFNLPPNVNAGPDQTVTLPAKASLAGAASDDRQPAGSTLSLAWSKASGPGNVTFSSASAAVTTAAFSAAGQYVLRLTASDSALTAADEVAVTVLPVNQPPTVRAGADQLISFPAAAALTGTATDDAQPPGSSLNVVWSKLSGPGEVSFADAGSPATTATFSTGGRYVLRLTASDSALSRSDDISVTVNEAPTANAGTDLSVNLPNAANLVGAVTDDALPPGKVIAVTWSRVSGPGAVTFSRPAAASTSATFSEVGAYVLRLTANDSLLQAVDEVTVNVRPPLPPPPSVALTSPGDGAEITSRTDIVGSVSGGPWKIEYSLGPDPAAPGSAVWTPFGSGSAPVSNGVLATFDPTLLLNGTYAIRLTASDADGQTTSVVRTASVTGRQKIGYFTLSFIDLDVPVAGLPIQLIRTYDSRDKRTGDFGVGWTLSTKDVRLEKSAELGRHWRGTISPGTLPQYCLQASRPNIVTITLPDSRVYRFQATTTKQCQAVAPIEFARFGFTPMPGTKGSLVPEAPLDVLVDGGFPGPVELLNASDPLLKTYDPTVFRFTDEYGTVFVIDQKLGLRSLTDPNGNRLTIGPDGITHSGGVGVRFVRDPQGRITQIVDPSGNTLTYSYDAAGDLAVFRDAEGHETKFTYDDAHGLLSALDPRGVQAFRNEYDAAGRIISHTSPDGSKVTYARDLGARRELVTDRLGRATLYEYDARGNVLRETDPNGGVTSRTYDGRDNQLTETNAVGKTTTFVYDRGDNLVKITDPLGHSRSLTYDSRGRPLTVVDERGGVTTFAYDARGNRTLRRTPAGAVTTRTYTPGGQVASETGADGTVRRYEYDRAGRLTKATDPLGRQLAFSHDASGNLLSRAASRTTAAGVAETLVTTFLYDRMNRRVKTTHPDGTETQSAYNSIGKQAAAIDQLGRRSTYEYDARGQLVKKIHPDGAAEERTYDAEGRATSLRGGAVPDANHARDALGRVVKTTYPDGAGDTYAYDALGRLTATTDGRGNTTAFEYDPNCGCGNRLTKIVDALGRATTYAYDAAGNRTSETDAAGRTTRYEYDADNRLVRVVHPDSTAEVTGYDPGGRVNSRTDREGRATRYEYDAAGRLVKVTDAAGQAMRYAYDERGSLVSRTDALNRVTRYEYDRMGRRVRRTLPDGASEVYAYNAVGRLAARTDFAGKTTTYAYDTRNRLTTTTPDPDLGETPVTFSHTPAGQRARMTDASGTTEYTYDSRRRLVSKTTPQGALTYSYDASGNVSGVRSSNENGVSMTYAHDALNRLASVTNHAPVRGARPPGGATGYEYDAKGNLAAAAYPNGVRTLYSYDSLDKLTGVTVGKSGTTLAGYTHTLSAAGNRLTVREQSGRSVTYSYDALDRLTGEEISGDPEAAANGAITYTYDAVGNRLSRTSGLAAVPSERYAYDANDRLTGESYDANGNTIESGGRRFAYDSEGRLKSADGGATAIVYDGDGNRVSQTVGGVTTKYLIDDLSPSGRSQVVEEIVGGRVSRVYTYGHGVVSQARTAGETWAASFYGHDGHGSTRLLTDGSGQVTDTYDYDAFGNLLRHTGETPNPYLFSGERRDQHLGLDYLRARYMNPATGRFLSMDPYEGDGREPLSLHKYLYAHANPVGNVDPYGLMSLGEKLVVIPSHSTLRTAPAPSLAWGSRGAYTALIAGTAAVGAAASPIVGIIAGELAGQGMDAIRQIIDQWMTFDGVVTREVAEGSTILIREQLTYDQVRPILNNYVMGTDVNPPGYEWNHMVEHRLEETVFPSEAINSWSNLVPTPEQVHRELSGFYARNGLPGMDPIRYPAPRDWMNLQHDWERQWEVAFDIWKRFMRRQPITQWVWGPP